MVTLEQRQKIEELVYRSCLALDAKDWKGYLDLCEEGFRYSITTYSPEIRKEMVWLDHDRKGMDTLFTNLPRHNSDHSPITRHATVYTVEWNDTKREAAVVSALQVFRTQLDGGASELFAVGRYLDAVNVQEGKFRLLARHIKLDTRDLSMGTHLPI